MAGRERTAEEWRADARGWEAAGVEVQDAAQECWERALALEPDDPESLLRLGRIHLRDQRLRRARECFERVRAAGDAPARAEAEEGLGKVEQAVQSAESGLESCRRILMVDSLNAPALACMAAHHQHLGDLREARLKFEDALGFGEPPFPGLKDLGTVHVECGDDEEAVGCFGRLLKAEPDRASVWYLLAAALRRLGRRDQALDCVEKSLALWPEGAAARWLAALLRAEAAGDDPPAPPAPAGT